MWFIITDLFYVFFLCILYYRKELERQSTLYFQIFTPFDIGNSELKHPKK